LTRRINVAEQGDLLTLRLDHFRRALARREPREVVLEKALNISTTVVAVHKVAGFPKKSPFEKVCCRAPLRLRQRSSERLSRFIGGTQTLQIGEHVRLCLQKNLIKDQTKLRSRCIRLAWMANPRRYSSSAFLSQNTQTSRWTAGKGVFLENAALSEGIIPQNL